VGKLVLEVHRFPLEFTHLVEWLYLDPFHILHRRDEPRDSGDIRGIVGLSGHQRESDPDRLAERGQPLCEAKRRLEITAGHPAVGGGVGTLDIEEKEVDGRQVRLIDPIAQKSGRLDGRMQAHLLGALEDAAGEGKLHHWLAARYGEATAKLD